LRAEILCVGSELLLGQIIDTNAAYIGRQLARAGIDVLRKQTVGDNLDRITDCIRGALSRADAVVITGGLGPTKARAKFPIRWARRPACWPKIRKAVLSLRCPACPKK
jgi:molybdenum cofactor synthesis domain-containing protein